MNKFDCYSRFLTGFTALLIALAAGCNNGGGGGSQDPILGRNAALAPMVTAVVPLAGAVDVAVNTKAITAAFNKAMDSATLNAATFTLACPAGTPVAGVVSYVSSGSLATLTLPAAPDLPPLTVCTATITTGAKDTTGIALASNFVWTFTTGIVPDTTRPRVTITVPVTTIPGPTPAVPTNTAITAVFTEEMAPLSITATSFTVTCAAPCVSPAGSVSYAVGSQTAVFTPAAVLAAGETYTATITTAATDVAGNALAGNQAALPAASNYIWSFTTAAAIPPANMTVLSTNPVAAAANVCPGATVNATFSVPSGLRMDPLTVTAATFSVTGPAPAATVVVAASVTLDVATGRIATFRPLAALPVGGYTATITGGAAGVKDLAIPGNTMAANFTWSFTVVPATGSCLAPIDLGAASSFGFLSSAALTNQGDAPNTLISGNAGTTGVSTAITGFHDAAGRTYTETCPAGIAAVGCGLVSGTIYASDAPPGDPAGLGVTVAAARAAALIAFNNMSPAGTPGGLDVRTNSLAGGGGLANELGGRTLAPGVYYSGAGGVPTYQITAGDLVLDAQGNPDAVWIFQADATLLVSTPAGPLLTVPRTVSLINGAQAKKVFWHLPAGATINTGSNMAGTMIANATITFGTATGPAPVIITRLEGRALVLSAGATMVNTVINVPAP